MADRKTKRKSGAFYKKNKKKREDEQQQLKGSLERFLWNQEHNGVGNLNAGPSTSTVSAEVPLPSANCKLQDDTSDLECEEEIVNIIEEESATFKPEADDQQEDAVGASLDSSDPSTWPTAMSGTLVDTLVEVGPVQVADNYAFPVDDETGRRFSSTYFYRHMDNGERIKRTWLIYSIILNCVFCFPCKLFNKDRIARIVSSGYSDWRHCSDYFNKHESSIQHIQSVKRWSDLRLRLNRGSTIDREQQTVFEMEKRRWRAVIKRMIAIVQFLASQCLAFRGSSNVLYERNNGNFLKMVEMIAKFDPVMREHVNKINKSKQDKSHMPHYLGMIFQNEIIQLIANSVRNAIKQVLQCSKYFSIMLDCTTDVSHIEQITFIWCVRLASSFYSFHSMCHLCVRVGIGVNSLSVRVWQSGVLVE